MLPLELRDEFLGPSDERADVADVPDPFAKFLADAELADTLGKDGYRTVEKFRAATAQLDKSVADHYRKLAANARSKAAPLQKTQARDEWDESLSPGQRDEALAKAATSDSHARRILRLREWLRSELALGKTVDEFIAHAERYDMAQAALIREAATGL